MQKIILVAGLSRVMVRSPAGHVLLCAPAPLLQVRGCGCWLGSTWSPWSQDSAQLTIAAAPPPNPSLKTAWPRNPAEIMNTRNTNCLYAEEVAGGWGHVEKGASGGVSRDLTLSYCPGARATQPLQHKVGCFGWSCGWRWARINMPTSALKPLRCKHIFASNCSGESGLLGALTF